MKVAAVQMVSGRCVADNLKAASRLIQDAVDRHAELVLLPENFAYFGGSETRSIGVEESTSRGRIRSFLSEQARRHKVVLIGGSLPTCEADENGRLPQTDKVFTSSFVFSPEGELLQRYDKVHLFDVDVGDAQGCYRESDSYSPGSEPKVARLNQVTVGLSICYDLRFPEFYRELVAQGAAILTVPAAFTYVTGEAHWQVLLRARAIENQCFVIAANQGGQHTASRQTWGHSCIVSPSGEILTECVQGEAVVIADLDFEQQSAIRRSMPVLEHRRL